MLTTSSSPLEVAGALGFELWSTISRTMRSITDRSMDATFVMRVCFETAVGELRPLLVPLFSKTRINLFSEL